MEIWRGIHKDMNHQEAVSGTISQPDSNHEIYRTDEDDILDDHANRGDLDF